LDIWFSFQEQKLLLFRIQREQANAAATKINQFVKEIERQMAWATQLPWTADTLDEWRYNVVRLLRQVPAVTEVAQLDAAGVELVRVSRFGRDVINSQTDFSHEEFFVQAMAQNIYYGPVRFVRQSEPYIKLAMRGVRREFGVIVADVNLKFIWDIVSQIKVGDRGRAYVVGPDGRLIAHPEINFVLRDTDLSYLAQVVAARAPGSRQASELPLLVDDIEGRQVLSAYAPVDPVGWLVFVELPAEEAFAQLYQSIERSVSFVAVALVLAAFAGFYLARRMVTPIEALGDGAARIGRGELIHRITIKTGDELEALGSQFNKMAAQLQESYATLERKVEERTHQLEEANLAKSRLLAVASHDLRQPLHALGLFVPSFALPRAPASKHRSLHASTPRSRQ
jgi:HAMP domain-containing protein